MPSGVDTDRLCARGCGPGRFVRRLLHLRVCIHAPGCCLKKGRAVANICDHAPHAVACLSARADLVDEKSLPIMRVDNSIGVKKKSRAPQRRKVSCKARRLGTITHPISEG